jgi:hypothetical protein
VDFIGSNRGESLLSPSAMERTCPDLISAQASIVISSTFALHEAPCQPRFKSNSLWLGRHRRRTTPISHSVFSPMDRARHVRNSSSLVNSASMTRTVVPAGASPTNREFSDLAALQASQIHNRRKNSRFLVFLNAPNSPARYPALRKLVWKRASPCETRMEW